MESRPLEPEQQAVERLPFWRRIAPASLVLVLLCVLWTVQIPWAGNSFRNMAVLRDAGAIQPFSLWAHEFWRLVTAIFLHGGWLHLALNGLSLYFVGAVIERGCGRATYLFFLFAAAEAGIAASLLWNPGPGWRMGISGGIAGLVGLVLAMEWGATKSLKEFVKQRNTIIVAVLLVLNVALSYFLGTIQGAKIDNAGHVGGFLCGLLGGLAFFPRSNLRVGRGAAVTLLLVLPPLAYATHSFRSPEFYRFRYREAAKASDEQGQIDALKRLLTLSPGELLPSIRLARLIDDTAPLEPLHPTAARAARMVVHAWLWFAMDRLMDDPEAARRYVERAATLEHAASPDWIRMAHAARAAGNEELEEFAFEQAYAALQVAPSARALWQAAPAVLRMAIERMPDQPTTEDLAQLLDLARESAGGLGEGETDAVPAANRVELLALLQRVASGVERVAFAGEVQRFARPLSDLYRRMADGTPEESPLIARFDFFMAYWWWRGAEGHEDPETREMAAGRFATGLDSARRTGNFLVEARCEAWFRLAGLPLPELAEDEDGG